MEEFLKSSPWMGNVRELRNFVERTILLSKSDVLTLDDFLGPGILQREQISKDSDGDLFNIHIKPQSNQNLLHEAQKQIIIQALNLVKNNRTRAAELLGIPRTTLNYYMQRFKILK
ncbi:MAG: helix-turn-helix domain-containing protein [Calditrichia bacterium]